MLRFCFAAKAAYRGVPAAEKLRGAAAASAFLALLSDAGCGGRELSRTRKNTLYMRCGVDPSSIVSLL